jgi:hypothetical protein
LPSSTPENGAEAAICVTRFTAVRDIECGNGEEALGKADLFALGLVDLVDTDL